MKHKWKEYEEKKAKALLMEGSTIREVAEVLNISVSIVSHRNERHWKIPLKDISYNAKLLRSVKKASYKISNYQKAQGKWKGKNNPNYGSKIVKRGEDNPLNKWRLDNPGYQNGDKNPSYGRVLPQEEIDRKTLKIKEFAKNRKGKTYKEIFGEIRALEIGKAMSRGSALRISKQKFCLTRPELIMKELLDSLPVKYEPQYPIDYYCVDFYIPDKRIVIQVDGCYWHGCPVHFNSLDKRQRNIIRLDHSCNSYLTNRGYKLYRFWECDLYNKKDTIYTLLKEAFCA